MNGRGGDGTNQPHGPTETPRQAIRHLLTEGPHTAYELSALVHLPEKEIAPHVEHLARSHDTHHPIASSLYYADQKKEAHRRARSFVDERMPKYLGWLEDVLARNKRGRGHWLVGRDLTYVDLSAFQIVAGLRFAFPNAMAGLERKVPRLVALHDRVTERPRIALYLKSDRRIPFNEYGIFRHYPELDAPPPKRTGSAKPARRASGK